MVPNGSESTEPSHDQGRASHAEDTKRDGVGHDETKCSVGSCSALGPGLHSQLSCSDGGTSLESSVVNSLHDLLVTPIAVDKSAFS